MFGDTDDTSLFMSADLGQDQATPPGLREGHGDAIPDIVIRRLPIYVRSLQYLANEDVETVSSGDLGSRLGVSAAQIRRDLSYFGEFGKQGKGYNVRYLLEQVSSILQLDREWPVALVGLGHLGRALLHYEGLSEQGFMIRALFDHNPVKIGQEINGLPIHRYARSAHYCSAREDQDGHHGCTRAGSTNGCRRTGRCRSARDS